LALQTDSLTLLVASLAFTGPFTVMRMIGEYGFQSDGTPTDGDAALVCVGIGVMTTDAVTAGATALPDPHDEPEFPWLYWREHIYMADAVLTNPTISLRQQFDIRSMRKMKARESLVMVVQYEETLLTPNLRFAAARTRVLLGNP